MTQREIFFKMLVPDTHCGAGLQIFLRIIRLFQANEDLIIPRILPSPHHILVSPVRCMNTGTYCHIHTMREGSF